MTQKHQPWIGRFMLEAGGGNFLGDARIRLLEQIDQLGSISKAAKAVPMSYKTAWDAIDIMNNLAEEPVVIATTGGRQGGGSRVSDYGHKLIALYRAVEYEYQQSIARLAATIPELEQPDVTQMRDLLRSMGMQFSARNQFRGQVVAMRADQVEFEVGICLDTGDELTAVITAESAERLGLKLGQNIQALIKSSAVILTVASATSTTARNCFRGTIIRIHQSAVQAEVVLELANGKTLTASVTRESVDAMGLAIGAQVTALFQASSVVLVTQS